MKKCYYCFYCQKEIKPRRWWFKRVCPHCGCYLTDNGSGFYKVCNKCNSNLPTDAAVCMVCGFHFSGENARKVYHPEKSPFCCKPQKIAAKSPKSSKKKIDFDALLASFMPTIYIIILFFMSFLILYYAE